MQDRRWLGKQISDQVKILVVGNYAELTGDVQNRIEATYLDEYSVQFEKNVSKATSAEQDEAAYKQLPRLTTADVLKAEVMTLEMSLGKDSPNPTSSKKSNFEVRN